ncbi:MAG: hypothetical protein KKB37_15060 [Alphaproteobacteria bacterium]|nr:hypothetical protein [Alphaproteobacteria bacterium]
MAQEKQNARTSSMPEKCDKQAFWRFDRDMTSRINHEATAGREPVADSESPVKNLGPNKDLADDPVSDPPPDRQAADGPPRSGQLRAAIDNGEMRDKVRYRDPAAAPLGTDDEAAGAGASGQRVDMAMQAAKPRRTPKMTSARYTSGRMIYIVFALVAAIVLVGGILLAGG